jgi:tetratricopeptide (TPR) repeat protein
MAAFALVAIATVSFGTPFLHDYSDSFPWRLRRYTPLAFGAFVCCALFAAGVGPVVTFLFVALLESPYLPPRGRLTLGVCLAVGCLMPLSLDWLSGSAGAPGAKAWALYRVWRGDAEPDLTADLARVMPPDDTRGLFARALVARRRGEYDRAADHLAEASKRDPREAALHLERGNLFFLRGYTRDALSQYELAASVRPNDPVPWLNRHVALLAELELADADHALERAKAIDAKAVERFQRQLLDTSGTLVPISVSLPADWVRGALLGRAPTRSAWSQTLRDRLFTPVRALHPFYFGLFALLVTFVAGWNGVGRRSNRCPACGFVVCPRCSRRVKGTLLCAACWAATRGPEADASEKDRQADYARKWRAVSRRWRRLGQMFLPGWIDFLFDASGRGLFCALIWTLGAGLVAQGLLYPAPVFPWGAGGAPLLGLILLTGAHLVGARHALAGRFGSGR